MQEELSTSPSKFVKIKSTTLDPGLQFEAGATRALRHEDYPVGTSVMASTGILLLSATSGSDLLMLY